MKKSTITAVAAPIASQDSEKTQQWLHRTQQYARLQQDWIPFNPDNPPIEPGIYWAVGYRQDERFGMPGLHPFQILIEVLEGHHELSIIPTATVPWSIFSECLPQISHVQPLYAPENPYTGTQVHREYV